MTDHLGRLYAVVAAVAVFFLTWAVVAARPWAAAPAVPAKDPRLVALEQREARVHRESIRVRKVLEHRYHVYRVRLRERKKEIAAINAANARAAAATVTAASAPSWSAPPAPSVGVVAAPPVTSTHTS
jgi:hypothetical protein